MKLRSFLVMQFVILLCCFLALLLYWLKSQNFNFIAGQNSPNQKIKVSIYQHKNLKQLFYTVDYKNQNLIGFSGLGLEAKKTHGHNVTTYNFPFKNNLLITEVVNKSNVISETWQPVLGEVKNITNEYKEITIKTKRDEEDSFQMNIIFRVYDDGIGFRYDIPEQKGLSSFVIADEYSEFNLKENYKSWWQAGSYNTNEYTLRETNLADIDAFQECSNNGLFGGYGCNANLVQTPVMLKSPNGIYVNIHEAGLVNYGAMQLMIDKTTYTFKSDIVPDMYQNKAYVHTPFKTPWRACIISDKATDIIASKLILNLNEPSKIKDPSWIKPVKYIGVWWEMFVGKGTWDYARTQNSAQDSKPQGVHSANTQNVKKYIDFASKHGFDGILVEGWNTGWEEWFGKWKEDVFDFVTPYPDFNVKELSEYAKSKNVFLIMHHETSGSATNYEHWIDSAYKFMNMYNYPSVKTGYVGPIIPRGEHHDGQWMVNHYVRVIEKAAKYKIMVDAHEPVRPTGLHRTYPNWLACEAARGMEYNAWGNGNAIDHDLNLIFTRFIGGPMDYTPGIFKLKLDYFPGKKEILHSTLCRQLALYVVMYSPLQMAADLPENYEAKLDAFQFIKDVPTNWDDTKILEAEPGEYITTARKGKSSNNWFIGGITDEKPRKVNLNLDFLDEGKVYNAIIYKDDAVKTVVDISGEVYKIEKMQVKKGDKISIDVVGAGGFAMSVMEAKK